MQNDTIELKGVRIPKVGFGTYKLTGSEGAKSIEDAIRIGYRHIDTAQMYGNEAEVGKAIKQSGVKREELFITTKVWPDNFKKLMPEVEQSLKKLGVDRVDLLLLHWPSDEETNKIGLAHLNEAHQKGYTATVGVSNFNVDQLTKAVAAAPVICDQVEYHPFLSQDKTLAFLRQHDMFLTAYRPLALGQVAKDITLEAMGRKYHKSPAQIALRWLIQQGNVAVIPKASSEARRRENLDIFDFELEEIDMKAIFKLHKGERLTDPTWAPKWD